jgi:TolB-like protein/Flp pilus assembly protein TadD
MAGPLPGARTAETRVAGRLDSWKAIAAYLRRDVTTVQRWERREGMPVHRHLHDKRGSVYALASELDAWRESRGALFERAPTPADTPADQGLSLAPTQARDTGKSHRSFRTRRSLALAALLLLALAAIPYWVLHRGRTPEGAGPKITSLAVLPLRNLSGDPGQDYLADGMTEALIGRLAQLRDLRVISHTSVLRFKDPVLSAPEIGRRLGVEALVEGSVAREGNRIRVTVQLIRAVSDAHFWSETYDREFRDALPLESELAQAIAQRVEVTVTGAERERLATARTVAPEVYENYLKGRFAYDRSRTKADYQESVDSFERAIRLDPSFAPAYLGLSQAYTMLGMVAIGGVPGETRPKAIDAARKALALDPNLTDAHVLLANIEQEQWHWREAEGEYRRALDLSPNDAFAHWGLALWLVCQGRTDEAIAWAQRGQQLDPIAVPGVEVAWILFLSHRYEEALGQLRSVLAVQPDDNEALSTLGFVLAAIGRDREAVPVLEKVIANSRGNPAAIGVLIRADAHSGRRADALKLLADLQRRRAAGYVPAAPFVNAYLGLGDTEAAFGALEQAYVERSNILQFLKVHPYFDPIRTEPRFAQLVRRVWSDPATTSP